MWKKTRKILPLCLMNYRTTTFHNAFVVTAVCFTIYNSHSSFCLRISEIIWSLLKAVRLMECYVGFMEMHVEHYLEIITASSQITELKFQRNSSWTVNWSFGGDNIMVIEVDKRVTQGYLARIHSTLMCSVLLTFVTRWYVFRGIKVSVLLARGQRATLNLFHWLYQRHSHLSGFSCIARDAKEKILDMESPWGIFSHCLLRVL